MTVFALAFFLFVGFDEDVIGGVEFNVEVAEGAEFEREINGVQLDTEVNGRSEL